MINNHIYKGAIQAPSPNFNGIITPRFIVMHYTASYGAKSVVSRFADPKSKVSAHITIDRGGEVYQHVPFNKRAWHAGPSVYKGVSDLNTHSIGIEMVNPGYLVEVTSGYKDAFGTVRSSDAIGPVIKAAYPRVGSGVYSWPVYTEAQLAALDALISDITSTYMIEDITGHEDIDTRGWKTDPGPAFPWDRYKKKVNTELTVTTTPLNIRSGPSTLFNVVGTYRKGEKVAGKEVRFGWVLTDKGWVSSKYLSDKLSLWSKLIG